MNVLARVGTGNGSWRTRLLGAVGALLCGGMLVGVTAYALVVAAGVDTERSLAEWRHDTIMLAAAAGLVCLALSGLLGTAMWNLVRQRRHAKEQLAGKEAQLDAALNNMAHGLAMFDAGGRIVLCNARYGEILRLPPELARPGTMLEEVVAYCMANGAGEQRKALDKIFGDLAAGKISVQLIETADGRSLRVVDRPKPDGGWVATFEDITLQRQAERERDQNQAFLKAVIDSVPTAIFVKDARTLQYVFVNNAGEKYLNAPQHALSGKTTAEVLATQTADEIALRDRAAVESRAVSTSEGHSLDTPALGTRILNTTRVPILDADGEPQFLLGVVEDVTERREFERQLRQAQKMDAVGQLTGGVAHDFNNILTVITSTIDILAEAVADQPVPRKITEMISQAADRGSRLTRHLLAFARKQPLRPEQINVNELILEATVLLKASLGEQIEIRTLLDQEAWEAMVDRPQLTTALLNLAVNARDAMPEGGRLTVETSNFLSHPKDHAPDWDIPPGEYVMLAVSDTGIGIPEAIREKVFEPFFSTKGVGQGTGLGLSMVYGFVKQSGGQIRICSEEGHGTTIRVYLPRAAGVPVTELPDIPSSEGGNEAILVVEDDPLVRQQATRLLTGLGYKTAEAAGPAEALTMIDSGTEFDLVFTDVVMPGMNGWQLAEQVRRRQPDARIVFTSGYTENTLVDEGRIPNGVLLLSKPYRKQELARIVRRALDRAAAPPAA
jgi:PAS domain S-box-containing protein